MSRIVEFFKTLTAYRPVFTSWGGKLYESELIRATIDAIARHASKLDITVHGTALPRLRTRLRAGPNSWMTWSQFLYRLVTIREMQNNAFIVPVLGDTQQGEPEIQGYFPILPSRTEIVEDHGTEYFVYTFTNGQKGAVELDRCGILNKYQYEDDFFGDNNRALNATMDRKNRRLVTLREEMDQAGYREFLPIHVDYGTYEIDPVMRQVTSGLSVDELQTITSLNEALDLDYSQRLYAKYGSLPSLYDKSIDLPEDELKYYRNLAANFKKYTPYSKKDIK